MYGIYGNIYHQHTPNVSINLPYIRILWVSLSRKKHLVYAPPQHPVKSTVFFCCFFLPVTGKNEGTAAPGVRVLATTAPLDALDLRGADRRSPCRGCRMSMDPVTLWPYGGVA